MTTQTTTQTITITITASTHVGVQTYWAADAPLRDHHGSPVAPWGYSTSQEEGTAARVLRARTRARYERAMSGGGLWGGMGARTSYYAEDADGRMVRLEDDHDGILVRNCIEAIALGAMAIDWPVACDVDADEYYAALQDTTDED